jgi:O-antigen ligase
MLLPTIVLSFYFWDGLFRRLLMAAVTILIAVSYATLASRGPLLFLLFTMIITLGIAFSKHRRRLSAVLFRSSLFFITCLAALFIVFRWYGDSIEYYLVRFFWIQESYQIRSQLFSAALDAIIKNPFWGIGLDPNNFIASVPVYVRSSSGIYYIANAHNVYLSLAMSLGLLGGIMFILIVIVSIWRLYKICHRSLAAVLLLSAILAFGLSCLTEPVYMNGSGLNNLFYLFLGSGFALCSKASTWIGKH